MFFPGLAGRDCSYEFGLRPQPAYKRLVETVKWAVDVPENALAQLGWRMTPAGVVSDADLEIRKACRAKGIS